MSWLALGADTYSHYPKKITQADVDSYGQDLGPPPQIYDSSVDTSATDYDASRPGTPMPQSVIDAATAMFYRPPSGRAAAPPVAYGPAPPTDMALTQRVVAQTNLQNQQAAQLSVQAQIAKIRGQQTPSRRAPSYPQPMTSAAQNQIILATQARQGELGTGAKVAAFALLGVAVLSVGALLFGGR